jgi:hypothetical protein
MSYDLYFWRQTSFQNEAPEQICKELERDIEIPGIVFLPIAKIKERFIASFPETDDGGSQLNWEGTNSYFQVSWPTTSKPGLTLAINISCGYKLLETPEIMNRLISVAQEFGCALYDPQTGERYQQPEPKIE